MTRPLILTFFSINLALFTFGQKPARSFKQDDLFGTKHLFIENIGQYADSLAMRLGMGKVRYGYQGFGLPVYFTDKGLIYIQRRSVVTMRWLRANPHVELIKKEPEKVRYNYGLLPRSAGGYRRLLYKDLYPGIDVEYSLVAGKTGFEYSIRVRAGADPAAIRVRYGGNVKSVGDSSGLLLVRADAGTILESKPVCYYADAPAKTGDTIAVAHSLQDKERGFAFRRSYNRRRELIIDPFVTSTLSALTGANAGKAMEVDYDYNGNVYVQGGTDRQGQIAKYDATGNLLWTFAGSIPSIGWTYGEDYGGWTVEKTTGNVYVGIGSNGFGGPIIRLNGATGLYDNFETPYFKDNDGNNGEDWKMRWFCDHGTYHVMIAGGSGGIGSYDANIGILLLPTTNFYSYNITGITTYPYNQDVSDFVIDPANNDIYCILASGNTPFVNNRIYRNTYPYTAANQVWNTLSGYTVLSEDNNTQYMTGDDPSIGGSNLTNILAVNSSNLFYYDGAHLKALDKATGATVGTPLSFAGNTPLMEEGIYADECNDIFIGMPGGVIKVLKWTGSVFDDGADADITIPGFSGNSILALAYDPARQLLYAAGDGFVGSFDISAYCASSTPSGSYTLSALGVCSNITASLSPALPPGATVTYTLLDGSVVLATNTSGQFNGITGSATYTVKAEIALGCTDITETANVALQPLTFITRVQDACSGPGTGALTVMTGGLAGLSYSINNLPSQADSVFPDLDAGNYMVTVTGNGCMATASTQVNGSNLTVKAAGTATVCEGSPVTLQGSTNGTNIHWTPSTGLSDPTIADPVAIPAGTTKYYFEATEGVCTLVDSVVITVNPLPIADAGTDITVCYGQNASLQGSGGGSYSWSPVSYLSNAGIADPQVLDPLETTNYVLRVTDGNGCQSAPDTMSLIVLPQAVVSAGGDTTILVGQTVVLDAKDMNGTGFTQFSWSPATGLNDAAIQAPAASPGSSITYTVTASTPQGCEATTSVKVTVLKAVTFLVPSAFTPDGNGHNDVLRVIAAGVRELRYFIVFNRWGQEVFRTSNLGEGWDGRVHGEPMPPGTYVWSAEAVDLLGRTLEGKGTVLLIR